MYHNYGLFNENHLFFRFNGLNSLYNKNIKKFIQKDFDFHRFFEEFLFKADRMYSFLERMNKIDEFIMQQAIELKETSAKARKKKPKSPELLFPKNALLEFNTTYVNEFLGCVPPFLNTLFVLQDRILRIIGFFLEINEKIPNKLPGFYDFDQKKWKPILKKYGANIENEVKRYYLKHANKIRRYRNLDQHNINLLEYYGVDFNENFHLYLPDNPRVKKYSELTYNNKIDALTIFNDEFDAFHTFVENLMKHLGIPEMEHQYGMGHSNQTVENFTEGECMALFQAKKEVICLYCGKKNEKNAAALSTNKLPLKYNKLIFSIG